MKLTDKQIVAIQNQCYDMKGWGLNLNKFAREIEAAVQIIHDETAAGHALICLVEATIKANTQVPPDVIPLKNGKYLKREEYFNGSGYLVWTLYAKPDSYRLRVLDAFEASFVDAALAATQPKRTPLTAVQRAAAISAAEKALDADINLSWRHALIDAVEAAHNIKKD